MTPERRMELAFELPEGYFENIANGGKCTKTDKAFLRIIHTFPWLLDVAEKGFDRIDADRIAAKEAIDYIAKMRRASNDTKNT